MKRLAIVVLLLLLVTSCVPGASVVSPLDFRLRSEGSGLLRLEPPGVGSGAAVIRLELDVHNPNPFGVDLAGLDGDLFIGGSRVASSRFVDGLAVPAQGSGRLTLDIEASLADAPHLVGQMARLVAGEAVAYRLDGTVRLEVLGTPQSFPSVTVARGELDPPGPLRPPTVRFDAASSGVRLSGLRAQIEVGLEIENPLPLGYYARGPELRLLLDGRPVGRASLPATPVPAMSTTHAVLQVEAGVAELGAALLSRLQGGSSGLQLAVDGRLTFELPGVADASMALSGVGGALR